MTGSLPKRWLFLWIAAAALYLFLLAPIAIVVIASFDGSSSYYFRFPPQHFSLAWYGEIPLKYLHAFGFSFGLAALTALISTMLGAMAALGIVRGRRATQASLEGIFRLPLQIPQVVTGVVFLQAFYRLADATGLNLVGSITGLVCAHVFITLPYAVSAACVVLLRTGRRFEEAAESLGASRWSVLWRVTLPAMKPGLFAGLIYCFIVSFGDVAVSLFLIGEDTLTLPVEIFQSLQFDFEPAVLTLSALVVVFSVALIVGMQKLAGLNLVMPSNRR
jgi:putative spermidine/putrescine transport system permease protein